MNFSPECSKVSLFGWDLKGFPKPVLKAMKLIHKVNDGKTPKRLIHVGVAVYRRFYHFNQNGLQIVYEIPKKRVDLLPDSANTTKSQIEFEQWFHSPEIQDKYRSETYHPVGNNCIDFSIAVCNFLDVPIQPGFHTDLNNWLKEQEGLMNLFKSPKLLEFFGIRFGVTSKRTFVDSPDSEAEEFVDEDELIGWEQI